MRSVYVYLLIAACYFEPQTWAISDGKDQRGSVTFDDGAVQVHYDNQNYNYNCATTDYKGRYLLT